MKSLLSYCLALLLAAFVATATAQAPAFTMPALNSQPLTAEVVANVFHAYEDILKEFSAYKPSADGAGIAEFLQAQQNIAKAQSIISKHGFKDAMDWYANFMAVMRVYAAHKLSASNQNMPGLQQQIAQIKSNPNLTEEQKAQTIQMLSASQGMMQSMMNASPAELKAIQPFISKFDALIERYK